MSVLLVQGDSGIELRGTLTNDDTSGPLDLTGCSVFFQMRKKDDNRYTINGSCAITNAAGGLVSYTTGANDLNNFGTFYGQFEVHYLSGKIITTKDPIEIDVRRQ